MESVLAVRTLMGLSVVKELSDTLQSSVETQRALAQKVSPYWVLSVSGGNTSACVQIFLNLDTSSRYCPLQPFQTSCFCFSQVEEIKEIGVFLNSLVQELADLREATGQGVRALQAKHDKLKVEILQAQERHQLVRCLRAVRMKDTSLFV